MRLLAAAMTVSLLGTLSAAEPSVNGEPIIQSNGAARFRVQGEFRPTVESARESALRTVQEKVRDWLASQTPPIRHVPGIETIRREMNPQELRPQEEQILNQSDKMYKITMSVELQPKLVRELRGIDRVVSGLWTFGALFSFLCVGALLFRIEEWTKGYLTRWLKVCAIALGLILLAVLLAYA